MLFTKFKEKFISIMKLLNSRRKMTNGTSMMVNSSKIQLNVKVQRLDEMIHVLVDRGKSIKNAV